MVEKLVLNLYLTKSEVFIRDYNKIHLNGMKKENFTTFDIEGIYAVQDSFLRKKINGMRDDDSFIVVEKGNIVLEEILRNSNLKIVFDNLMHNPYIRNERMYFSSASISNEEYNRPNFIIPIEKVSGLVQKNTKTDNVEILWKAFKNR